MRVTVKASKKLKDKLNNNQLFQKCLKYKVCPKCGLELNTKFISDDIEAYTDFICVSKHCNFTYKGNIIKMDSKPSTFGG